MSVCHTQSIGNSICSCFLLNRFFIIITESLGWSVRYFLLGAVLVVPLWIIWRIISAAGRRS